MLGVVTVVASLHRFRGFLIAIVALALSASLAFGAEPPAAAAPGLANAASHAGKTVPVKAGDEDGEGDEGDEAGDEESAEESAEEAGEHCATDPRTLTEEQLAELNHGAIVCWAAHQTEWPAEFENHGAWVRSWAQSGKADDESEPEADAASAGNGHGKGKGNPNRD